MRIGIDMRVVPPQGPGQQRYLWRLGSWLAQRGHDVHYMTVLPQKAAPEAPAGTHVHDWHRHTASAVRGAVQDLALDALLLNPERSRPFRGIRANVLRAAYGTEQYLQKLRSFRNPLEYGMRKAIRALPWTLADMHWERQFYEGHRPFPDVIAQSGYMRDQILGSYRIPPEHVHVVHNAVDTEEYTPARRLALRDEMRARWQIPPEALCLLFLGHNFRLKGLWQMLQVLPRLGPLGRPVHLLVAGKGTGEPQRRKARRLVRSLGLERQVTFAGDVRPSLHAHAAADALLHLSWHDSFGFVSLEAMASGLPVVTTPYVGAAELIVNGESGLVVDPARDEAIIGAIRQLADDAFRARVGAAAAVEGARHDEPRNFAEVHAVIRTAVARGAGPITAR
ncbi:glycosyltransferase family 4 protein [Pseudogemmatithrix spongiicola]|uniref:Glycosyltransferase family 4 protein n=1 Tax=Pseudogemmatithrix spongiicola TaxID=3062599 RepID=A0AA49K168_9BACT|nr:glycosyltransferase family 4 protein [Gemmatimonadaceae bacterium 'strain 138']WKW15605.1 glycosyltransferase family 4 protein [Gemmatimonadaceae bacterium 'strain 318']